jgi:integrase
MARHGLRVTEAVDLQWDQIDFTRAHLHVRRLKGGIASVHPIQGDELRALRELRRQSAGAFVFASERGGPIALQRLEDGRGCGRTCRVTVRASPYVEAIRAGICWPMRATTRGVCNCGSDTRTSSTPRTMPN